MIGLAAEHLSPQVGLIPTLNEARHNSLFIDGSRMFSAQSGYLKELHPELDFVGGPSLAALGSGCAIDGAAARAKAVVETLERYATAFYSKDGVVTATARSLGDDTIDWTRVPPADAGCGERHPCFDPGAPLRWVRGYHLVERRPVLVPLVMVHVHVSPLESERFHQQSTSGVAAHASLEEALLAAFHEAVERDSAGAVWAMRLPLHRIEMNGSIPAELQQFLAVDQADYVEQRYFDATTDLGIPTVYAVRELRPPVGRDVIVTCASHSDPAVAALKARREAAGLQAMRMHESGGACYSSFAGEEGWPVEGLLPGPPDLSFLDGTPSRYLTEIDSGSKDGGDSDPVSQLRRIAKNHPDIIALNLTTDSLCALGIHVVRIIIPTLLQVAPPHGPALHPRKRLEQLARHFGVPVPGAAEINPCPQPFR